MMGASKTFVVRFQARSEMLEVGGGDPRYVPSPLWVDSADVKAEMQALADRAGADLSFVEIDQCRIHFDTESEEFLGLTTGDNRMVVDEDRS